MSGSIRSVLDVDNYIFRRFLVLLTAGATLCRHKLNKQKIKQNKTIQYCRKSLLEFKRLQGIVSIHSSFRATNFIPTRIRSHFFTLNPATDPRNRKTYEIKLSSRMISLGQVAIPRGVLDPSAS